MKYDFLEKLEEHTDEILKRKDRVLISVVGKGGAGKSYFGKYIRKS
jgi:polynucleotide 5'-kinase involved in rRNA processing